MSVYILINVYNFCFEGSDDIRPFWEKYFEGQHGILYVINAAAKEEELKVAVKILTDVLSNSTLKGIPCVILATHQDISGAKSQVEVFIVHYFIMLIVTSFVINTDQFLTLMKFDPNFGWAKGQCDICKKILVVLKVMFSSFG